MLERKSSRMLAPTEPARRTSCLEVSNGGPINGKRGCGRPEAPLRPFQGHLDALAWIGEVGCVEDHRPAEVHGLLVLMVLSEESSAQSLRNVMREQRRGVSLYVIVKRSDVGDFYKATANGSRYVAGGTVRSVPQLGRRFCAACLGG